MEAGTASQRKGDDPMSKAKESPAAVVTTNPCKLCAPLGASMVLKGIRGALPLLHGSQGCATYIRRYLIGHFREPADIASSSFSEETTIFGGAENLKTALVNIARQYKPELVGIATTCLAETIGEDVKLHLKNMPQEEIPDTVIISCPSYSGTHMDGYRAAIKAVVEKFSRSTIPARSVTLFSPMLSCAELTYLKNFISLFKVEPIVIPDYSETLDGGTWDFWKLIPEGGTTIGQIESAGDSLASIEMGYVTNENNSAGVLLNDKCGVPSYTCAAPIGTVACDNFAAMVAGISGVAIPAEIEKARAKLVDAYIDGHKFVAGKKVMVFGDEDHVIPMTSFLAETGLKVVAVMTGAVSEKLRDEIKAAAGDDETCNVLCDADFAALESSILVDKPDLIVGSSKGYYLSRRYSIPLVRTGFPIHDRLGSQRLMHIGYEGTLALYDAVVNTLIETSQDSDDYGYMTW